MIQDKVLKLSTAGSVDDGKSTLIGRLLYDTHSLKKDKLETIEKSSKQKGFDYLDFSLATDGLVAERQQGITIDVAHIYFATKNRSYIIADTPGHIEYTRNMITGASTSDISLILVDARNGVVEQTKRHYFISNLLRIKHLVVVVNKMDLVGYSEAYFQDIVADFQELAAGAQFEKISFVPVSALFGDNVVELSQNMDWYKGESLMTILEHINLGKTDDQVPARFQVQTVIRPKTLEFADFRGYAGKIKGGEFYVGDEISVMRTGTTSKIKTIEFYDQQYQSAGSGSSVTMTLEDDVDISRGDLIAKINQLPQRSKELKATICWMDHKSMRPGKTYSLQYGVDLLKCKIVGIESRINKDFNGRELATQLDLNDLGVVRFKLSKELAFDTFEVNRGTGVFILIDPHSHATCGVGLIEEVFFKTATKSLDL